MLSFKNTNATFLVIFKHCGIELGFFPVNIVSENEFTRLLGQFLSISRIILKATVLSCFRFARRSGIRFYKS